jgi:hypothetical protein
MDRAGTYQRVLAVVGLFTVAAGDLWRYLLSWWGWGGIVALILVLTVVELVRGRIDLRRVPIALLVTLGLMTLSIAWSAYRLETALAVVATLATTVFGVFVATVFRWSDILDLLGVALRWVLGLSLLFELVVATLVRRPVLPLWVDWSHLDEIPRAFYWSRDLLFEGGRIQGIVGNANLLAMIALLAAVVFAVQFAIGRGSRPWLVVWSAAAVVTLALTRSSTVTVAAVVVVAVGIAVVIARRSTGARRVAVPIVGVGLVGLAGLAAVLFRGPFLALLGRSDDLTNRLDIWEAVARVAAERPVAGWGWVGYWPPWTPPFENLVVIRGVSYLQAHNAWLDIYLQLGVLGIVALGILVLTTVARGWAYALDGPRGVAAFPMVLLAALLVQSLAESRLLIEIGWTLLVIVAVRTAWPTERA